ncbi:MAG: zinc dependent phospholipase C family protein [Anaerolineaceae bacterium]|nr:zinc dependent phospholipase C family protein [Anaerolineaceae bacterium]
MKRRIIQNAILIALVAIMFCCTMLTPETAYAWQTKTHGYSANLLLKDAEDGSVTVDGVSYELPEEYAIALKNYPAAFRAGSLGPDYYPDIVTGQMYIHPYDAKAGKGVGDWLMLLVDAVNSLPKNSDERMKVLSFTLGMAVHYAGDQFGHDFINAFAGSAYPAYLDTLEEAVKKDPTKMYYILRHMMEETYVDKQIGSNLGNTEIKAPAEFIAHTWIYDGPADNGHAKIYDKYSKGMMLAYKYLVDLRTWIYNQKAELKGNSIPNDALAKYADRWMEDLDTATVELVKTFNSIAQDILVNKDGENHKNTVDIVSEHVEKWWEDYGIHAGPQPDFVTDLPKLIDNWKTIWKEYIFEVFHIEEFLQITGIRDFLNAWDDFKEYLKEEVTTWGL